jgi:ubiquinone biosynthesis monooxygenase Coq7
MRVNHTGEVCAQALYAAQAAVAGAPEIRARFAEAAREEEDHLAWTKQRLEELGTHASRLNFLWYAGSFAMGLAAGAAGDRRDLPPADARSRAVVSRMRDDEARHGAMAQSAGAEELAWPLKLGMRAAAAVMKVLAYRV